MVAGPAWFYRRTQKQDWLISLIPLVVLVALGSVGVKPFLMAFWSNMTIILIGCFYQESKMRVPTIVDALEKGTLNALSIGAAVSSVGIIIGMVMLTGLGLKFGNLTIEMAKATAAWICHLDVLNLLTQEGTTLFLFSAIPPSPVLYSEWVCRPPPNTSWSP